jgi:hypothetical protein
VKKNFVARISERGSHPSSIPLAEIASISKIVILKLAAGLFEPCSLPHRWVARNLRKYIYIFTPCIFSTRSIRVNGLTTMLFSGRRKKTVPEGFKDFKLANARNAIFSALGKVPAIWLKVERKNRTKNTNRTETTLIIARNRRRNGHRYEGDPTSWQMEKTA